MVAPAIIAALAAKDDDEVRNAMIGEGIGYIAAATDPLTFDPRAVTGVGGVKFQTVLWQERLWFRDESDVSVADEITVITLADGANYLTNDVRMPEAVISRVLGIPPADDDSPPVEFGDVYLVPAAATDEWADHEDDVAIWTARGWYYRPPAVGHLLYVRDELGYIHYSEANTWENGIGAYALEAGSVRPSDLLIRSWEFEDQTTTAPPATGPAGEQYVIGPSATGAWSGHDKKIAWRPAVDAAFVITTPFVGEVGYDKDSGIDIRWNGTAWVSAAGKLIDRAYDETSSNARLTAQGNGDNSVPQAGEGTYILGATIITKSAESRLKGTVMICGSPDTGGSGEFLVFATVNSELAARAAVMKYCSAVNGIEIIPFHFEFDAGAAGTFLVKIWIGATAPYAFNLNGTQGGPLLGGTMKSTFLLEEIAS